MDLIYLMISVNIIEVFCAHSHRNPPPFTAMPQYWNFHKNLFEREMEQTGEKQLTIMVCFDSFELQKDTLKVSVLLHNICRRK